MNQMDSNNLTPRRRSLRDPRKLAQDYSGLEVSDTTTPSVPRTVSSINPPQNSNASIRILDIGVNCGTSDSNTEETMSSQDSEMDVEPRQVFSTPQKNKRRRLMDHWNTVENKMCKLEDSNPENEVKINELTKGPLSSSKFVKIRVTYAGPSRKVKNELDVHDFHGSLRDGSEMSFVSFANKALEMKDIIKENQVYRISNCILKSPAEEFKKFSTPFEVHLQSDSIVVLDTEEAFPEITFSYSKINQLTSLTASDFIQCKKIRKKPVVDILAVLIDVDLRIVNGSSKLELGLTDDTKTVGQLNLYGQFAERFADKVSTYDVLAIRHAELLKPDDDGFPMMKFNPITGSLIQINPSREDAAQLKAWYLENKVDAS